MSLCLKKKIKECLGRENMSRILANNRDFVTFLLKAELKQAKALLDTINRHQTEVLVEILYNIANIASKKTNRDIVRNRRPTFRKLLNKRIGIGRKTKLISKHKQQILKTLSHFKWVLLSLIK